MSKFDFMAFGYSAGDSDMFVAHAKKYTPKETVALCKREYEYKFRNHTFWIGRPVAALREPTVDDVLEAHCAFRFGVSGEWPDGCYTLVGDNETGSFPVYVIDFDRLKQERQANGNEDN